MASVPSEPSSSIPLRRSPTAETLDSMTTEDLTNTTADESVAPVEEASIRRRTRRPLLARIQAKRLQVQRQQQLRGRQRSLVEDYYKVDTVPSVKPTDKPTDKRFKVVLPGVPTYEADRARDLHDFFNLVILVPVVVLNVLNWNWETLAQIKDVGKVSEAWTGEYIQLFFCVTLGYFVTDLLWVAAIPTCVRSPSTILQHHVAVLVYLCIPYNFPEAHWLMGACMSVELNTWFLIARRVFNKQGFPPWTLNICSWVSIRVKVISIFFYLTWFGIRCFLYPALLVPIYHLLMGISEREGSKFNLGLLGLPLHGIFCLLNLKWSYELLMSKIRYWRRLMQKTGNETPDCVSKGL